MMRNRLFSRQKLQRQMFFLRKWAYPGLFSFIFGFFKQIKQFVEQINLKKCHVHPVYYTGI